MSDSLPAPFMIAADVREYLVSKLRRNLRDSRSPVLQLTERSWIGETFVGAQVILGYVASGREPKCEKIRLARYEILVPIESAARLKGKALVFETVELSRTPVSKQVRLIRVQPV